MTFQDGKIDMKEIVLTVTVLRNEVGLLPKPLAETEFRSVDRNRFARCHRPEESERYLPIHTTQREVC
jgi:hypothetical protein